MYCQSCSAQIPEGVKFCGTCGTQVISANSGTWKCGNCDYNVSRENYNCPRCGDSYELSVEYLVAHPEVRPYEADFSEEDGLFKRIFSNIFVFVFLSALLIMVILLIKYLMF